MASPLLQISLLAVAQAQKEVTVNEAIQILEAFVVGRLLDRNINAPPGSPAESDMYLLGGAPTGAWAGQANKIALLVGGGWLFFPAVEGLTLYVADEDIHIVYDGAAWNALSASGSLTSADISDFTEAAQDAIAAMLSAGSNVTLTYNDIANLLTVAAASGATYTDEQVRDAVAAFLTAGTNVTLTHNDAGDTLTIDAADSSDGIEGSASVLRYQYGTGSSGTIQGVGIINANTGSTAGATIATTNRITRAVRHSRSTGLAAGAGAGLAWGQQAAFRDCGFTYEFRGGIETLTAGMRMFIGMKQGSFPGSVDPSSLTNMIGFARDTADTNIQLMHNDGSGTATKADTGIALAAGDELYIRIHCAANGDYDVTLKRFDDANLTSTPDNTYNATVSTDIPAASQGLNFIHWVHNAATAAAAIIAMIRESLRTPF